MIEYVNVDNRDQVLLNFHRACEHPSAQDLIDWAARYPQFAEDIRAHAAILHDWADQQELPQQIPDDVAIARARSRALNVLHTVRKDHAEEAQATVASFGAMMAVKGTNIRELARQFDIDRGTLADMVGGAMLAPVGERLVAAWTSVLQVSRAAFDGALASALATPRLGHASANGPPQIVPRSYEEIVRSSTSMSEERKNYWLSKE